MSAPNIVVEAFTAIITLESDGLLLGGTRRHVSSPFESREDAEAFAEVSTEINKGRPGYSDAIITTVVRPVKALRRYVIGRAS